MVLVRRIHNRGANIVVEAHGEVLFGPLGPVPGWMGRLTQRVRAATALEAPTNRRPRWGHYGKPLKTTIKGSSRPRRGVNKFHLYSAVGSTAPHAYYVDQGTGVYAGNGPYEAKILPPWTRGSPSLYEHTWRPPGSQHAIGTTTIKGQRGQFFFDKGLKKGFQSMRLRSYQVPGEGVSAMSGVLNSAPSGLANFLGNTVATPAFRASLEEWRSWRDVAFNDGRMLGVRPTSNLAAKRRRSRASASVAQHRAQRKIRRAQQSALRSKRWRAAQKAAKGTSKPKQQKSKLSTLQRAQAAAARERAAWLMKHPQWRSTGSNPQGFYVVNAKGEKAFHVWSINVSDLFTDAGLSHQPLPPGVKTV